MRNSRKLLQVSSRDGLENSHIKPQKTIKNIKIKRDKERSDEDNQIENC